MIRVTQSSVNPVTLGMAYSQSLEGVSTEKGDLILGGNSLSLEELRTIHPPAVIMLKLWQTFVENVNPLIKILHAPTMQKRLLDYSTSLDKVAKDEEALLFGIYLTAVQSMSDFECQSLFGQTKSRSIRKYYNATKNALIRAEFMSCPGIVILQAFSLYLLTMRHYTEPGCLWMLTGVAVRLGQRLGLHRDGLELGLLPFETEMRRRLWWALFGMDTTAAEFFGAAWSSRPVLSSTKRPLNINDSDLNPKMRALPAEHVGATEMIFMKLRVDMASFLREAKYERGWFSQGLRDPEIESTQMAAISQFEIQLKEKYFQYCDPNIPLHLFTLSLGQAAFLALKLVAKHPRRYAGEGLMPKSERDEIFNTSIELIQHYLQSISQPYIQPFLWHMNAHFQWHAFAVLVSELCLRVDGEDARIGWDVVERLLVQNPEVVNNQKAALHKAVGTLILKAWAARESHFQKLATTYETPSFVRMFKALKVAAADTSSNGVLNHYIVTTSTGTVEESPMSDGVASSGETALSTLTGDTMVANKFQGQLYNVGLSLVGDKTYTAKVLSFNHSFCDVEQWLPTAHIPNGAMMRYDTEKALRRHSSGFRYRSTPNPTPDGKDNFALPHVGIRDPYEDIGTVYERYTQDEALTRHKSGDARTVFDEGEGPAWLTKGKIQEGYSKFPIPLRKFLAKHDRPYLKYLKRLRHAWPGIGYLAEWMDVSTSPPRVEFLKEEWQIERAKRTHLTVVEYNESSQPTITPIRTSEELYTEFMDSPRDKYDKVNTKIIIVEDLSREVIEVLGSRFDIEPLFFCGQTADYKWYNTRDAWFEAPTLQIIKRARPFYQMEYVQAKYFPTLESKREAERELGKFNVLRRNESDGAQLSHFDDEKSDGGIIRSKLSVWVRPNRVSGNGSQNDPETGTLAIVLVDPSITTGFPLWGGYHDFSGIPRMSEVCESRKVKPFSTFDDLVDRFSQLDPGAIKKIQESPREILRLPLMRIASEWHLAVQYATTRLAQVTWELERPAFLEVDESSETTVQKLNPWRRRLPYMIKIVGQVMSHVTDPKLDMGDEGEKITASNVKSKNSLADLHPDFSELQSQLSDLISQTDKILSFAIGIVSIEESRKGIEQNSNVARLTYIALVFVPLSFLASLFSMTTNLSQMKQTFWVYFAVAIPTSLLLLVLARYGGLADKAVGKKKEKSQKKKKKKT
ncbi:putative fungal specific transcription factor domain-containing protein [Phaeomoniella chlamydospora]|uniref:Putative fungal specific transcription factor domain-containing protein n=1 Tax=Phaeomoniella chlamydospora TaxID=158046 RepID=A0A0G2E4Q2_PHACM|nr:putative fungal specific transcription factor domain-containing protein [Phaeomoniella chlamydospora]